MRTRLLLDEWFKDDRLAELSVEARLLFMGLNCFADREGLFEWRPKRIQIEIFPYDGKFPVEKHLRELEKVGLIKKFNSAGHDIGLLVSFKDDQKPHPHEAKSKFKDMPLDVITCPDIKLNVEITNIELDTELEIGSELEIPRAREAERQVTLAPKIVMAASAQVALVAEFGERQVTEAAQTASDWLLAEGKTKKDYAAFLRNWLRRSRETGRTAPQPTQFKNSRERNEQREALAMERLRLVEESGAKSLFHVGLDTPKLIEVKK